MMPLPLPPDCWNFKLHHHTSSIACWLLNSGILSCYVSIITTEIYPHLSNSFFINRIPLIRMLLPWRHYKHRNIKNLRFLTRLPLEMRYLLELWSYAQNRTPGTTKMIKTYKRALCSPNIWWTSKVHVHFYVNYRNYFATKNSISRTDNIT